MPEAAKRTLSRDTTPKAEPVQIDIFRRMSGRQKLELVEQANRNAREMALAGLHYRHPEAGPEELFRRLMDLTLGEELPELLRDQKMIERWRSLDQLPDDERDRILFVVDGLIRDAQARRAYAAR